MSLRNKPLDAAIFGVDIGKNVFHVVGLDGSGLPIQRATFRRETLLQFFERASPTVVGMEACPGSQWLARKLMACGHTVRIVPAKFVKPYVKSNKNDIIDAEAIAEAVTRPTMRFVEVRSPEQIDLQALHRVRDRLVAQRTRVICQMRAFCLEYGIAMHQGVGKFKADLPRVLGDMTNELTLAMRKLLASLLGISKRGSSYLRRLLVHGARSCLLHLDRSRDRLGGWLSALQRRMHNNQATVALAAKIARIAWVVITKPGATYERRGLAAA